jgi:hypothetical protein
MSHEHDLTCLEEVGGSLVCSVTGAKTEKKSRSSTLPEGVTSEMLVAYRSYDEIARKYASNKGYYDRSQSDNIKLGQRWKKLQVLIEASGQELDVVVPKLVRIVLTER